VLGYLKAERDIERATKIEWAPQIVNSYNFLGHKELIGF
jgi:hypothetical protein